MDVCSSSDFVEKQKDSDSKDGDYKESNDETDKALTMQTNDKNDKNNNQKLTIQFMTDFNHNLTLAQMQKLTWYEPIIWGSKQCSVAIKLENRIKIHIQSDGNKKDNDFWIKINEINAETLFYPNINYQENNEENKEENNDENNNEKYGKKEREYRDVLEYDIQKFSDLILETLDVISYVLIINDCKMNLKKMGMNARQWIEKNKNSNNALSVIRWVDGSMVSDIK